MDGLRVVCGANTYFFPSSCRKVRDDAPYIGGSVGASNAMRICSSDWKQKDFGIGI